MTVTAAEIRDQLANTTAKINGEATKETNANSNTKTSSVDSQAFLNLMCMQLQYQDPTNPMDNSEMLAQEAQFATLEQMEALTSSFTTFSASYQANALLGQYVEVTNADGATEQGYVDFVNLNEKNGASVSVNGVLRPLSQVTKILPANELISDNINKNTSEINNKLGTIGESIANLADKLGQYLDKDKVEKVISETTNQNK